MLFPAGRGAAREAERSLEVHVVVGFSRVLERRTP
jgi:hypothetical protein